MGSKKKADPAPRTRGLKASHRRRVELIKDLEAMRWDLNKIESRIRAAEVLVQKDYWTLEELGDFHLFKERLKP